MSKDLEGRLGGKTTIREPTTGKAQNKKKMCSGTEEREIDDLYRAHLDDLAKLLSYRTGDPIYKNEQVVNLLSPVT